MCVLTRLDSFDNEKRTIMSVSMSMSMSVKVSASVSVKV